MATPPGLDSLSSLSTLVQRRESWPVADKRKKTKEWQTETENRARLEGKVLATKVLEKNFTLSIPNLVKFGYLYCKAKGDRKGSLNQFADFALATTVLTNLIFIRNLQKEAPYQAMETEPLGGNDVPATIASDRSTYTDKLTLLWMWTFKRFSVWVQSLYL